MNYYAAKFERERKDRPIDWVILPGRSGCRLVNLREKKCEENSTSMRRFTDASS